MVHASAVARVDSDEVMIFMGNSGSGKSSLALYLIEQGGFDYISNDRVMLKARPDGVHVIGLPKKPRVNPGTLLASTRLSHLLRPSKRGRYEQMPAAELWGVEDKHDVDVHRALGAAERLDGRLANCFSLEWRPDGRGRETHCLDEEGVLSALLSVRKDFGPFDRRGSQRASEFDAEYRRLARAISVTRVTGRADPVGFAREWAKAR
jgi:HprK-related kinase B